MNKNIIAVIGANGKMGSLLCEKLKNNYSVLKFTKNNPFTDKIIADCVIDFANSNSSVETSMICAKNKIPLLVASTGQTSYQLMEIRKCAREIPIILSSNLSLGIYFLKKMMSGIVKKTNFEITIIEKHHSEKKDSPSGTAKMLRKYIIKNKKTNVNIISERGGKEIGTHTIDLYFGDELISLTHKAFSREAFINGAILSIDFLLKNPIPKLYSFDDVVKMKY